MNPRFAFNLMRGLLPNESIVLTDTGKCVRAVSSVSVSLRIGKLEKDIVSFFFLFSMQNWARERGLISIISIQKWKQTSPGARSSMKGS